MTACEEIRSCSEVVDCFTWLLHECLARQGLQHASKNMPMSQRAVTQVRAEFNVVRFSITVKLQVLLVMRHTLLFTYSLDVRASEQRPTQGSTYMQHMFACLWIHLHT